jgi:dTDP-glucose 4,6-dehydratase
MDRAASGIQDTHPMKKVLVTGSCGFILSNFMRKVMREGMPYTFISVDKVLAPYNQYNVKLNGDHIFYMGDIADEVFMNNIFMIEKPDIIIHGAAESFVDDSIKSAGPFIHSNVVGTQVMVDMALKHGVEKFIYVSTDEVYGQLSEGDASWTEESPLHPRNPYSASKAAGELIVRAAGETHSLPYIITRCCNNYGPSQPPRNLVPKAISSVLEGKAMPIHGSGKQMREWIYVDDHCSALQTVMEKGVVNETYNIGSGVELANLDMVERIGAELGKKPEITLIKDRPGHDFRYSVDCSKLEALGWKPEYTFETGLAKCVAWYTENDWYLKSYGV